MAYRIFAVLQHFYESAAGRVMNWTATTVATVNVTVAIADDAEKVPSWLDSVKFADVPVSMSILLIFMNICIVSPKFCIVVQKKSRQVKQLFFPSKPFPRDPKNDRRKSPR